jgi:inner membrane protein
MRSAVRSRAGGVPPLLAVIGTVVLDLVLQARDWPLLPLGVLDESAHLLTAWLALAALTARTTALPGWPWVLAGAMLLDLDHVPLILGAEWVAATAGGRPVTHSLTTVVVLLTAATTCRGWRIPLIGLAAGAALHLARDIATGPGVPLFWPFAPDDTRLPYWPYLLVLGALATLAVVRRLSEGQAAQRRLP